MPITIRDLMQLDLFQSLQLVAGASGGGNTVSKVGILDYEFSRRGGLYNPAGHWEAGEFVLASMAYARDNPALLLDAVKKLRAVKTSGMAIKNVYALEIPHELKQFADRSHYPLFIFTDNNLFFETIIIGVHDFLSTVQNQAAMERTLARLMLGEYDGAQIARMARDICYSIRTRFATAYFLPAAPLPPGKRNMILSGGRDLGEGCAVVGYRSGFFYIRSQQADRRPADPQALVREAAGKLNLSLEQFSVGVSETQYFLGNFKKSLRHSYDAALHSRITGRPVSNYGRIGLYQLLLPHQDDPVCLEYFERLMAPLWEYDAQNRTDLVDTMLAFESCHGNISAAAQALHIHGNTIRYRLRKAAELAGLEGEMEEFVQQIVVAVKLYRIRQTLGDILFD